MAIDATGRHPRIQELAMALQADKSWTGKRRVMGQVLETFVNGLLRDFDDSAELISALEPLVYTRRFLQLASLNPHKPSDTMVAKDAGKTLHLAGGQDTTVNTE